MTEEEREIVRKTFNREYSRIEQMIEDEMLHPKEVPLTMQAIYNAVWSLYGYGGSLSPYMYDPGYGRTVMLYELLSEYIIWCDTQNVVPKAGIRKEVVDDEESAEEDR